MDFQERQVIHEEVFGKKEFPPQFKEGQDLVPLSTFNKMQEDNFAFITKKFTEEVILTESEKIQTKEEDEPLVFLPSKVEQKIKFACSFPLLFVFTLF